MRARLVELDEHNVALARKAAQAAGLRGVEVLQGDAGSPMPVPARYLPR